MTFFRCLIVFSGAAFIFFGILCLDSQPVISDFKRFGIESLRVPAGLLEILGGVGMLVGLKWRLPLLLSSAGLSLMMLIAFCYRLKVRDSVALSAPSFLFSMLNLFIFLYSVRHQGTRGF